MLYLRALSVVCAVVLQSLCAAAQETSSSTGAASETAALPPMVVSATRGGPRSAEDLPVSVTVISREEIEASPAATVDDILRTVPGIQLPLTSSNTILPILPSISMRGLGLGDNGTRTLVLVDGLPANGAFFGNVFWNRVPKQNVERIEIVRGSGSAEFGTYALGGVVNIVTRRLPKQPQVQGEVGYGTQETFQANLYGGVPVHDALRLSLNTKVHIVTFGATYQRPRGLQFTVRGRYLSEQFQDTSNETRLPSHVVIDASASYPVTKHLTVFLRVDNLFDEDYIADAFGGLHGAPRQAFGGVRVALP